MVAQNKEENRKEEKVETPFEFYALQFNFSRAEQEFLKTIEELQKKNITEKIVRKAYKQYFGVEIEDKV